VQTLIDLPRRLEIKTVAEWVQDEDQPRCCATGAAITFRDG
jgi:hypothetical protein